MPVKVGTFFPSVTMCFVNFSFWFDSCTFVEDPKHATFFTSKEDPRINKILAKLQYSSLASIPEYLFT